MTHSKLWNAIDRLAQRMGKSRSALAIDCGLHSTTFNPSKRFDKNGKERWPSVQTVSKVLKRYNIPPAEFFDFEEPES